MSDDGLTGLPAQLGRYQLVAPLGRGGMGRVVRAHDPVLKRDVALKIVELAETTPEQTRELRFLFHREARATAALRHPNIVEIFDYSGPDAAQLYLAVELCEGPTLRQVLDQRGALPAAEVAALGHELAGALAHAHERGILHRDLKPENIFWLESGRVVLADFGIAKALTNDLGNTLAGDATRLRGSPAYMAPEQLEGGGAAPASDIHALGATLFETFAGQPAFVGADLEAIFRAVLNEARPRLAGKAAGPVSLCGLIERALAKALADRPTATVMQQEVRAVLDELEVTDPRATLRNETAPVAPWASDDEAPTLFDSEPATGIRVRGNSLRPPPSRWGALLGRGTLMFGLLAIAALVGGIAFVALTVGMLPDLTDFDRHVPPEVQLSSNVQEVWALLRFPGEAAISVDGREIGRWEGQVRLTLAPGLHRLTVHFPHGAVEREVTLLRETTPIFDFDPAEAVPLPPPSALSTDPAADTASTPPPTPAPAPTATAGAPTATQP